MKKTTAPVPQTEKAAWKGFLERPLSAEELEAVDGWKPADVELWEHIQGIAVSGIDVSLSWSSRLSATTVTFKDQRPNSKTAGYAMSARGSDALDAMKIMIYKHNAALEGDWTQLLGVLPPTTRG